MTWRSWTVVLLVNFIIFISFFEENLVINASHVAQTELQSIHVLFATEEQLKTGYHFRPPRHWINDPNAPMYYKGIYHLFYQYNPEGSVWGNIVWAHSYSTDLINWKDLPAAMSPSEPFDQFGCWSGSATVLHGDKPVILYTGVIDSKRTQVQNIAFPRNHSDPFLQEWVKPDYNPIIVAGWGVNATDFRDPTTAWYHNNHWKLIVGTRWNREGKAILYRSKDFRHWSQAKRPLHTSKTTGMWECPDFYPVAVHRGLDTSEMGDGMKYVMKASLDDKRYDYYTVGSYNPHEDVYLPDGTSPDDWNGLRYDYGNFYASKSFFDPAKQRRILWGWVNESDSKYDDIAKGWAGIQAIPRTILLDRSGRQLVQWPIEEVEALRGKHIQLKNKHLHSGGSFEVEGIDTSQADVEVVFNVPSLEEAEPFDPFYSTDAQALCAEKPADVKGGVGPFGLEVLASASRQEATAVFFRIFKFLKKHVVLMCNDPTRSSLSPGMYKPTFAGFIKPNIAKPGKISLRVLIDHSVVESFGAKGKTCITSRVYPSLARGSDAHIFVFNHGRTPIHVSSLKAWEMNRAIIHEP